MNGTPLAVEVMARIDRAAHGEGIRNRPALLSALLREVKPFLQVQEEWDRQSLERAEEESQRGGCYDCAAEGDQVGLARDGGGTCPCPRGRLRALRHKLSCEREEAWARVKEETARDFENLLEGGRDPTIAAAADKSLDNGKDER